MNFRTFVRFIGWVLLHLMISTFMAIIAIAIVLLLSTLVAATLGVF